MAVLLRRVACLVLDLFADCQFRSSSKSPGRALEISRKRAVRTCPQLSGSSSAQSIGTLAELMEMNISSSSWQVLSDGKKYAGAAPASHAASGGQGRRVVRGGQRSVYRRRNTSAAHHLARLPCMAVLHRLPPLGWYALASWMYPHQYTSIC